MSEERTVMDAAALRRYMEHTQSVGCQLHCLDCVDSTNAYLKRLALDNAPDGTVVIADRQTAGRGRRGRSYESAAGLGIYLSVLLRPTMEAQHLPSLTALAAVAVCNAIEEQLSVRPQIKWVNDLILHGKKLCGIMTELLSCSDSAQPAVILGIGINVNHLPDDWSADVAALATSLRLHCGEQIAREPLAAALLRAIDRLYTDVCADSTGPYLAQYRADCMTVGQQVRLVQPEHSVEAEALAVTDDFGLLVRHRDGTLETVRSGEVSVRGLYGYAE